MTADKKKLILHSLAIVLSSAAVVLAVLNLMGTINISVIYVVMLVCFASCCTIFATNIRQSSSKSDKDENGADSRNYSDNGQ